MRSSPWAVVSRAMNQYKNYLENQSDIIFVKVRPSPASQDSYMSVSFIAILA